MSGCNGWKNRETWKVALWIGSESLSRAAVEFMRDYTGRQPYRDFVAHMGLSSSETSDGVAWLSPKLAYSELNATMRKFADD